MLTMHHSRDWHSRSRRAAEPFRLVPQPSKRDLLSPVPGVLLDEKLPGPLYGLPAVDADSHRLNTYPCQPKNGDLHRQRENFELELLSWRAMWNSDLPIHRLPPEVLLQIFECLLSPTRFPLDTLPPQRPSAYPERPWTALMGVCRHWCALIRNTSTFWRDIVIPVDINAYDWMMIELALHRVGDAPIRVDFSFNRDARRALKMLTNHVGRIEKLRFHGEVYHSAEAIVFQKFLAARFPILQSLMIDLGPSSLPIAALCGPTISPRLKSMSLAQTTLHWRPAMMTGLEALSLTDCKLLTTTPLPLTDFLDILERGQRLRYLHLEHFLFASLDPQSSAPRERSVTLPHLQHLICHDVPSHVARLMTHLHMPQAMNINLVGDCIDVNAPSAIYASLLPEDYTRVPILPHATSVCLEVAPERNQVWCTSAPSKIGFALRSPYDDWPGGTMCRALRELPTLLGAAVTKLQICGYLHNAALATWDLVFESFPMLECLALSRYGPKFPTPAILSLSTPVYPRVASDDGVPVHSVRCPNLKQLEFLGWKWSPKVMDDLLECLLVRIAHGARKLECLELEITGLAIARDADQVVELEGYRELFCGTQAVDDISLVAL